MGARIDIPQMRELKLRIVTLISFYLAESLMPLYWRIGEVDTIDEVDQFDKHHRNDRSNEPGCHEVFAPTEMMIINWRKNDCYGTLRLTYTVSRPADTKQSCYNPCANN